MSMKKLILLANIVLLSSCGGTIKDVSFETGDYLGTGYDLSLIHISEPTRPY